MVHGWFMEFFTFSQSLHIDEPPRLGKGIKGSAPEVLGGQGGRLGDLMESTGRFDGSSDVF